MFESPDYRATHVYFRICICTHMYAFFLQFMRLSHSLELDWLLKRLLLLRIFWLCHICRPHFCSLYCLSLSYLLFHITSTNFSFQRMVAGLSATASSLAASTLSLWKAVLVGSFFIMGSLLLSSNYCYFSSSFKYLFQLIATLHRLAHSLQPCSAL